MKLGLDARDQLDTLQAAQAQVSLERSLLRGMGRERRSAKLGQEIAKQFKQLMVEVSRMLFRQDGGIVA